MRLRWEDSISQFVSVRQQGFLRRRSILRNLLEVEDAMAMGALTENAAAAIFLDFAAAFPSISQEYVHTCLLHLGMPENARNAFLHLYSNSACCISLQGASYEGFAMKAGVRQGCPLSPLIYALVAEVMVDKIAVLDPEMLVRAYADDTALVIRDFWAAAPCLANFFQDLAAVSGLQLNLNKSIIIPLAITDLRAFGERLVTTIPSWASMPVQLSCKYLGFFMGPGKDDQSWRAPMRKFRERVGMWRNLPLGLFWDTRVCNTFCLPVLTYVAQLETPPQWVLAEVDYCLHKLAPGPAKWATTQDLHLLKQRFGLSASFGNLEWTATAAKVRVTQWDSGCEPRAVFAARQIRLRGLIRVPTAEEAGWAWASWLSRLFSSD
jgi:hypothetical protein